MSSIDLFAYHKMTKAVSRKTQKEACAFRAAKRVRDRNVKASVALKFFFHGKGGQIQREILDEGYLILSYLTSYCRIVQFYFKLVRHLLLCIFLFWSS